MARLRATSTRWGTTSRQRNRQRTPHEQRRYVERTYGSGAAYAWWRAFTNTGGDLRAKRSAAALALAPYRYLHR